MASVYLGRLIGARQFQRVVAMKCLHEALLSDKRMLTMLIDEARTTSRLRHPNIIDTLDVAEDRGSVYLVMEFVLGETLSALLGLSAKAKRHVPPPVASAMVCNALRGLHAAHEAVDYAGKPLGLIHRDVTPQNILIGVDGIARLLDFGVAKAEGREQLTQQGEVKGKLAYMPPEYLTGKAPDLRADVFGIGVVAWEVFCRKRLFAGSGANAIIQNVIHGEVPNASQTNPALPSALDAVLNKALNKEPAQRYQSALEFAQLLEQIIPPASPEAVGAWVNETAGQHIAERAALVRALEQLPIAAPQLSVPLDAGDDEKTAIDHLPRSFQPTVDQRLSRQESDTQSRPLPTLETSGSATVNLATPAKPARRNVFDLILVFGLGALIATFVNLLMRPQPPPVPKEILMFLDAGGRLAP
jgi:eukaryotic-like serine/threonine-protein kinase